MICVDLYSLNLRQYQRTRPPEVGPHFLTSPLAIAKLRHNKSLNNLLSWCFLSVHHVFSDISFGCGVLVVLPPARVPRQGLFLHTQDVQNACAYLSSSALGMFQFQRAMIYGLSRSKYTTIAKGTPWAPLPKSWIWETNTIVSVTTERMRHQTLRLGIEDKRRGWRHRLARIKSGSF